MSHVDDGQLNALLDGELPAAEARAVESHVATCADCRRRLEEARSFLDEANSLLETLSPGAAASAPLAPAGPRAQEPARPSRQSVPVRPVGSLADLPGGESGGARPPAPPAAKPPLAPAASAPPGQPPRKVAKTLREIAVDIDGRTGMAPGISPVFTDEAHAAASGEHVRPARRGLDLEKLAWAANIVLALGVGFLANEVRWMHSERQPQLAQQPAVVETVTVRAPASTPTAANRADRAGRQTQTGIATRGSRSTSGTRHGTAAPIAKSPNARGPKTAPGTLRPAPAGDLATRQPRAPDALASAEQQAPRNAPAAAAQGAGAAGGAQPAPSRALALTAAPTSRQRANALDAAAVRGTPGFTRITMEEAVHTLSSSIRQVDGMTPLSIESGGGRLVPGSDASREVVRVNYADQYGRRFMLDQQLAEPRAGRAFNGIIPGDTLVAPTADGGSRVRWLDGKFWLSLSGPVPAGEIRALVGRVR